MYTGRCGNTSEGTVSDLRNRLSLFAFADFLDMPDQKLQECNLREFKAICKTMRTYSSLDALPGLVTALYRGCDNDVPFFKECLAAFCRSVPHLMRRTMPSDDTTGELSDLLFWTMFKAYPVLAADAVFHLGKAYYELEHELDTKKAHFATIVQRLSAQQRQEFYPEGAKTFPWHQQLPSIENLTSEYLCQIKGCRGYFTDYEATKNRKYSFCPYCGKGISVRATASESRPMKMPKIND
jgi:hypothetical protein